MQDPTSVMGRRLVAGIFDYFLLPFGLAIASLFLFGGFEEVPFCSSADSNCFYVESGGSTDYYQIEGIGIFYLVLFVVWVANLIVVQGMGGASLGKYALGLRVVDEQGATAGFGPVVIRQLLWLVDGIGCFVPLVGPIAGLASKGHRRIGDMAAKTNVVAAASVGTPPMPGVAPGGYAVPATPPAPGTPYGAAPPAPGAPAAAPSGPAAAPGSAGEPQWDAERGTYIQWDGTNQRWMAYDQASGQWHPIS